MGWSLPLRVLQRLGFKPELRRWARRLDDRQWLNANVMAARSQQGAHPDMPMAPDDDVQIRFTGRSGTENLQQAFDFYRFCLRCISRNRNVGPYDNILDFGCGWGRISRFWLREAPPSRIWCIDCLGDAIDILRSTRMPANILKNDPLPPVAGLPHDFRLIYAFSVFSHLSEILALKWIEYFADLLQPGGYLIFTTRGQQYLADLRRLRSQMPDDDHQVRMLALAPSQEFLETRYAAGEFVFFGTGGGGELTDDFYGEAIIPEPWVRSLERYGLRFCELNESVPGIDQAVVVLQKANTKSSGKLHAAMQIAPRSTVAMLKQMNLALDAILMESRI